MTFLSEKSRYVKLHVRTCMKKTRECLGNVGSGYFWVVRFQMRFTFFVFFVVLVSFHECIISPKAIKFILPNPQKAGDTL